MSVTATAEYTDEPITGPDEVISGDRHTWLRITVTNTGKRKVQNVHIDLLPPLGHGGVESGRDGDHYYTFASLDELGAGETVTVRDMVWVPGGGGADERPQPELRTRLGDSNGERTGA